MKILGIAGTSRAGKSTLADFFMGIKLTMMGITDQFNLGETLEISGDVLVDGRYKGKQLGPLDHRNLKKDRPLNDWLEKYIWPTIKVYSLATPLKDTCMSLFGLTLDQCYGGGKDSQTNVTREAMRQFTKIPDGPEFLTAREVMVYFGSGVCRGLNNHCFVDALIRQIEKDRPKFAIIDDVRQDFEQETIHQMGGQIIKLTRGENIGLAESGFNNIQCDFLLDNKGMTLMEKNEAVMDFLDSYFEDA